MKHSIFVQICSYRDSELLPTLRDLFEKASGQHHIVVGLVWQKDSLESIEEFENHSQVKIISYSWKESHGLGWARSIVQSLYNNEDYTLQLDSHHRFLQDWDSILIDMYKNQLSLSPKPILTSYACGYSPEGSIKLGNHPCQISPVDFKKSGTIWFNPHNIPNYQKLKAPIRARFISGHYYFTTGQHCLEYKYDPDIYFAGDEISLSVRSFTLGYDLYHPNINIIWHYYGRNDQPKHWSDHTHDKIKNGDIEKVWSIRDKYSKQRIRQLLGEENNHVDLGVYGLGQQKSLNDYEKYSGIDFKQMRIQKSAIKGLEPPVLFQNNDLYEQDFCKITTINITGWDKDKLLSILDDIKQIKLQCYCLKQTIIYSRIINAQALLNQTKISQTIISDNQVVSYDLIAYDSNDKTLYKLTKELYSNLSWY